MLRVFHERLKSILNNNEILYADGMKSSILYDKDILEIDGMPFDDYILDYANKNNIEVLYNGYQYDYGFKSANELAIRKYNIYPNTIFLPLSDALLGLISNFIDEYDSYESSTFIERAYEVFKLISMELKDLIIIFDMDDNML